MRISLRPASLCLLSVLFLPLAWAADLKTSQEIYKKSTEQILQRYQPKFDGLQQQYRTSLEALRAQAQGKGDLKQTLAAKAEIERFEKAKSMPSATDEGVMPVIKSFQSDYVKQYNRLEQEMTAELGALAMKYDQALDRLQKELTKAGKLDAALAVQPEREKAQAEIKDYADRLAVLKGPDAERAARAAELALPLKGGAATPARQPDAKNGLYLVIDLLGGKGAVNYPVSYLRDMPKGGWTDEYKTEKLVLRRIEPGKFKMGSPEKEQGRKGNEAQHKVTLTRTFYIGVFEVTHGQWERVMGNTPNTLMNPALPLESVSYDDIRGSSSGAGWPKVSVVDDASFMGVLRRETGLAAFDLPTEAQWEYACRAGADGPYAGDLNEMAWYKENSNYATHPVGAKRPNAWGLYDMHGNLWEWCLDWKWDAPSGNETDPVGATLGSARMRRGGGFNNTPDECRAAYRHFFNPHDGHKDIGFRVAATLP